MKPKILIVDDKEANIYALLDVLEDIDAQFITATSGNDAVALTLQHEFAIILLDVQMPDMDGFETLEFIRKEDKNKLTPVIFLSAVLTSLDFRIKGITTGAIDFIIKPVEPIILIGKINHFLNIHKFQLNLQKANSIINATLEATAEGILVLDRNNNILKFNQQFYKMWKYQDESLLEIGAEFELEHILKQMDNPHSLKHKFVEDPLFDDITKTEFFKLNTGQIFELNKRPKYINKKINGFVYNFKDITEQKNLEEKNQQFIDELSLKNTRLEEKTNELNELNDKLNQSQNELIKLNASKDKFFSIISHDLRSPLSALLGLAEILREDYIDLTKEELDESIVAIDDIAKNIFELLDGLLEWSRAQRGQLEFQKEKFKLYDKAQNVISLLEEVASNKNISMINLIDKELIIKTDKNVIKTILRNLIGNSIKFTNPEGRISINCNETESEFIISVADTGIGMDEETKNKLFKIEEHITTPGTNKERGTGVGLILCKELVNEIGGKIWCDSIPGEGSTFYFTLSKK